MYICMHSFFNHLHYYKIKFIGAGEITFLGTYAAPALLSAAKNHNLQGRVRYPFLKMYFQKQVIPSPVPKNLFLRMGEPIVRP